MLRLRHLDLTVSLTHFSREQIALGWSNLRMVSLHLNLMVGLVKSRRDVTPVRRSDRVLHVTHVRRVSLVHR